MNKLIVSSLLFSLALSPVYAVDATAMTPKADVGTQQQMTNIVGQIMVIDKNEIAAAKVALEKSNSDEVKAFATYMNDEHSKNLDKLIALSHKDKLVLQDTKAVNQLKKKGEDELALLNKTSAEAFDKVYMTMMVKGHQEALSLLDEQLMMQLESSDIKTFLKDTRSHVEQHLIKAQKVEKNIK